MRHQLLVTEPIPGVASNHAICRVREARVYVRPSGGGLLLGGYENDPMVVSQDEVTTTFSVDRLELDAGVLRRLANLVGRIFPDLVDARLRVVRGGIPTMTPDGWPLIGPAPGIDGLFVAGGCNVGGFSISPAVGELLTAWILTGRCPDLLKPFRADRFGAWPDDASLRAVSLDRWRDHYRPGPTRSI